jgi:Zn-dependent alcohol dehydrogenase
MTREERQRLVDEALAITLLGASEPTLETQKLIEKYIAGEIEIPEMLEKTIERYKEINA